MEKKEYTPQTVKQKIESFNSIIQAYIEGRITPKQLSEKSDQFLDTDLFDLLDKEEYVGEYAESGLVGLIDIADTLYHYSQKPRKTHGHVVKLYNQYLQGYYEEIAQNKNK